MTDTGRTQSRSDKVIFFDVDGVLTYIDSNPRNNGLEASRIALLKQIVDQTGAMLVCISSWKGYPIDGKFWRPSIYHTLEKALAAQGLVITDETAYIKPVMKEKYAKNPELIPPLTVGNAGSYMDEVYEPGYERAAEVYRWLQAHPEVNRFVILDDEDHSWKDYGYDLFWIRPNYFELNGGLKPWHVKRAIELLLSAPSDAHTYSNADAIR